MVKPYSKTNMKKLELSFKAGLVIIGCLAFYSFISFEKKETVLSNTSLGEKINGVSFVGTNQKLLSTHLEPLKQKSQHVNLPQFEHIQEYS